jgi:hypothetical protein
MLCWLMLSWGVDKTFASMPAAAAAAACAGCVRLLLMLRMTVFWLKSLRV